MEFDPKIKALMEQLKSQFAPVFSATPAGDRAGYVTPEACLHEDVLALGLKIAGFDMVSAQFERKLLAEMLSFLESSPSPMPYSYVLQTIDNQIASAKPSIPSGLAWPDFASIAMAKNWAAANPARIPEVRALLATYSEIINCFIIRDGKISDGELRLLSSFEERFAR